MNPYIWPWILDLNHSLQTTRKAVVGVCGVLVLRIHLMTTIFLGIYKAHMYIYVLGVALLKGRCWETYIETESNMVAVLNHKWNVSVVDVGRSTLATRLLSWTMAKTHADKDFGNFVCFQGFYCTSCISCMMALFNATTSGWTSV